MAESLSLPLTAFEPILDTAHVKKGQPSASSLEAIHYMLPRDAAANPPTTTSAGCDAHVDKGLLTLVYSDIVNGLEVRHKCSA